MLKIPAWKIYSVIVAVFLSIYFSLPSFLALVGVQETPGWLPDKKVNLGLDLQGGSYLLLEVDVNRYMKEQMENAAEDMKLRLRQEKIKVVSAEPYSGGVRIELADESERQKAKEEIRNSNPDYDISTSGNTLEIAYSENLMKQRKLHLIEQSIEIVRRRVDETGTKEPIIQRQGENRILLQVPGVQDPEHLKSIVGQTAKMTFHLVDTSDDAALGKVPPGSVVMESDEKRQDGSPASYVVKRRVMLSGDSLVDSHATYEQGMPVVTFRFDSTGARKFADITRENVNKPFAIVLDNKVISAPVIREPIMGGSGIISGNFTVETANDLALLLRAGALPAPLKVIEERTVGPSLGLDSIEAGKFASLFSLILIMVFMVLYYSLFGLFSDIALLLNLVIIIATVALIGATLTLPGIAGVVLSLGMAVDANVLIYEGIKEEIANGKTIMSAVESGFKRAFITIIDSHITTLMAAGILYMVGSGTVKGFAVTLAFGIASSLFTATLVNRILVYRWVGRFKPKKLPI